MTYETRCKMGRTGANVRATKSHLNFSQPMLTQSTPLDPELMFRCVLYNFGALGTVWLSYKTRCKMVVMVQKFVPRSRVGIFRNERTRSTPLDPKQTFWCISYYLGAFDTVWLPYETRCTTGRTSAKVRATKSRRNFSQRTHRKHPIGT